MSVSNKIYLIEGVQLNLKELNEKLEELDQDLYDVLSENIPEEKEHNLSFICDGMCGNYCFIGYIHNNVNPFDSIIAPVIPISEETKKDMIEKIKSFLLKELKPEDFKMYLINHFS